MTRLYADMTVSTEFPLQELLELVKNKKTVNISETENVVELGSFLVPTAKYSFKDIKNRQQESEEFWKDEEETRSVIPIPQRKAIYGNALSSSPKQIYIASGSPAPPLGDDVDIEKIYPNTAPDASPEPRDSIDASETAPDLGADYVAPDQHSSPKSSTEVEEKNKTKKKKKKKAEEGSIKNEKREEEEEGEGESRSRRYR